MPLGDAVLARLEREGLRELTGSALGANPLRIAGVEVLLLALGKILVPMVCAFTAESDFDQYETLQSAREVTTARVALAKADLIFPPRWPSSVVRDRALTAAQAQGLSEERGQLLVDHALKTIETLLAVPSRRR